MCVCVFCAFQLCFLLFSLTLWVFSTFPFWPLFTLTNTLTVRSVSVVMAHYSDSSCHMFSQLPNSKVAIVTFYHFDSRCHCSVCIICDSLLLVFILSLLTPLQLWQLATSIVHSVSVLTICYLYGHCQCSLCFSCDSVVFWVVLSLFTLYQLWQFVNYMHGVTDLSIIVVIARYSDPCCNCVLHFSCDSSVPWLMLSLFFPF